MKRAGLLIVACNLAAAALVAGPLRAGSDEIDDYVRAEMRGQNIPGLSLAVARDGKIVKAAGYGLADRERRIAATPESVYKIASVSKQFIAAGVMVLVQDGKLRVDDSIAKYLNRAPSTWAAITIRHLLAHTSGLPREAPGFSPSRIESDADVIRRAYGSRLSFSPGAKYEYGNLNYFAAAEIIRVASGLPWPEFIHERIFKPAGMATTWPTNTKASIANRAVGYVDNEKLRVADDWPALRASGAFLSTVLDLVRWDTALYTNEILTESSKRTMWTPTTLSDGATSPYGLGWQLGTFQGAAFVRHTGGMPGARAMFLRFPERRLAVIILMNLDDVDLISIAEGITQRVLATSSLVERTRSGPG